MNSCNTIEYEMIVGYSNIWTGNFECYIITAAEGFISCTCYSNDNCRSSFSYYRNRACVVSTSGRIRITSYKRFVIYDSINGVGYTRSKNKTKGYRVECWIICMCFKSSINFEGVRIRGYTTGNGKYWRITNTKCYTCCITAVYS